MHQRQDGSAALKEMQQGKMFLGKTLNGSAAQQKMRQGKIFFEKTLTASSLPPHSQVVMPALFVQQHGDKMYKCVTLKNVETGKKWVVEINILFPQKRTQALLYYGWRAFAAANGLAIGDRLSFVLVAQSLFHVYIRRRGGNSSLAVEKPKLCAPARRSVRRGPNLEPQFLPGQPQLSCDDISTNGCKETELLPRTGVTKEIAKETAVAAEIAAEVAAEAPDSSRSPAPMNSLCIEPMIPQEEQECIICLIAKMTKLGLLGMTKTGFHTAFDE